MPKRTFSGKTDIGLKRSKNEDAYVIDLDYNFCLAADGIGGSAGGDVASKIFADSAITVFSESSGTSEEEVRYRVHQVFRLANKKIRNHIAQNPDNKGMGCTAELLAFTDDGFVLGHVGDSRTYRLRDGQLRRLTQDHTLVQQQLDKGVISIDNIRNHPLRNVILRAVGIEETLSFDLLKGNTLAEDLFMLCSDGLTDMVQEDLICEILKARVDLDRKLEELIDAAKTAGGSDNITAVLAQII
jgi:protein phosphatase